MDKLRQFWPGRDWYEKSGSILQLFILTMLPVPVHYRFSKGARSASLFVFRPATSRASAWSYEGNDSVASYLPAFRSLRSTVDTALEIYRQMTLGLRGRRAPGYRFCGVPGPRDRRRVAPIL